MIDLMEAARDAIKGTFFIGDDEVVAVKIIDKDSVDWRDVSYHEDHPNGLLQTYYLVNPDKAKLETLKEMVEHRFDFQIDDTLSDEEIEKAEEFNDCIWDNINEFIEKNFIVLDISDEFIINY